MRNEIHTQNNAYMKMSSKYDQSGRELSIPPPQGLPFHVLQPTEQTGTSVALEVASRGNQTTPFRKVISRRHFFSTVCLFFKQMGIYKTCDFSNWFIIRRQWLYI